MPKNHQKCRLWHDPCTRRAVDNLLPVHPWEYRSPRSFQTHHPFINPLLDKRNPDIFTRQPMTHTKKAFIDLCHPPSIAQSQLPKPDLTASSPDTFLSFPFSFLFFSLSFLSSFPFPVPLPFPFLYPCLAFCWEWSMVNGAPLTIEHWPYLFPFLSFPFPSSSCSFSPFLSLPFPFLPLFLFFVFEGKWNPDSEGMKKPRRTG